MPIPFQEAKFTKSSIKKHEAITVVGKKGTGKSVLFDTLLLALSKKTLIILIDTKREYLHIPFMDISHLSYKVNYKTKKKEYAFNNGLFRVVAGFQIKGKQYDDLFTITEWLAYVLFEREKCMLAVEELGNCTKKFNRFYDCNPYLAQLVQQGRQRNVGFLGTTQRLQEIHTTILSESDHIICFRLTSESDEKYMKNYILPDHIRNLGTHEFLHLNLKDDYLRHCNKLYLDEQKLKYYTKTFGKT